MRQERAATTTSNMADTAGGGTDAATPRRPVRGGKLSLINAVFERLGLSTVRLCSRVSVSTVRLCGCSRDLPVRTSLSDIPQEHKVIAVTVIMLTFFLLRAYLNKGKATRG